MGEESVLANKLDNLLAGDGPYGKLFSGLETNHLQLKYFREHLNLVVSDVNVV